MRPQRIEFLGIEKMQLVFPISNFYKMRVVLIFLFLYLNTTLSQSYGGYFNFDSKIKISTTQPLLALAFNASTADLNSLTTMEAWSNIISEDASSIARFTNNRMGHVFYYSNSFYFTFSVFHANVGWGKSMAKWDISSPTGTWVDQDPNTAGFQPIYNRQTLLNATHRIGNSAPW
jgi:hypothetical protein